MVRETKEGEARVKRIVAAVRDFGVDKQSVNAVFEAGLAASAPEEVRWGPLRARVGCGERGVAGGHRERASAADG